MKISLKVKTNQKNSSLEKLQDGSFLAKVKAIPTKNQANLEIIDLLAKHFEIPKNQIKIKSGHFSANKIVEISV